MKINKNKFNEMVREKLDFQYVDLKKVRNKNSYDIIVSINDIETSIISIRDVVDEVCAQNNIEINKILIEV